MRTWPSEIGILGQGAYLHQTFELSLAPNVRHLQKVGEYEVIWSATSDAANGLRHIVRAYGLEPPETVLEAPEAATPNYPQNEFRATFSVPPDRLQAALDERTLDLQELFKTQNRDPVPVYSDYGLESVQREAGDNIGLTADARPHQIPLYFITGRILNATLAPNQIPFEPYHIYLDLDQRDRPPGKFHVFGVASGTNVRWEHFHDANLKGGLAFRSAYEEGARLYQAYELAARAVAASADRLINGPYVARKRPDLLQ
jgi:hypothetical protein